MKKKFRLYTTYVVIIGIILILLKPTHYILLSDQEDHVLVVQKSYERQRLTYHSIHSVSNTPLIETLEVNKHLQFVAKEVRYMDQGGAGMPEYNWGESEFFMEGQWFVIKNSNQVYDELIFQVEEQYENEITIDGYKIILYQLLDSKGAIKIKVHKKIYLYYLIQVIKQAIRKE